MSSSHTTPTSPGSPSRTGARTDWVTIWLFVYRITAYITGVTLLVLTTSVVLHYGFGDTRLVWIELPHGILYMCYFVTTVLLGSSVRWQPRRMVLVALAGTIPLMSFVAERSVTREVRSRAR